MNKLTVFQKRMIVLGIGLLLVVFGAVQATFQFDFFIKHKRIVDDVALILMAFGAVVFFSNRKSRQKPEGQSETTALEKTEETTDKESQ